MAQVYISGSSNDYDLTVELANRLRTYGHKVFNPFTDVAPGVEVWEAVEMYLPSSDAFVPLLSEGSLGSSGFEREMAMIEGYVSNNSSKTIIPIITDQTPLHRIPVGAARWQVLRRSSFESIDELAVAVDRGIRLHEGKRIADQENRREVGKRVQGSATSFIQQSLTELREKESLYRKVAYVWYAFAILALASAIGVALWKVSRPIDAELAWPSFAQYAVTVAVLIGLLAALAKLTFVLGKSFMVESLRNSDRIHAIKFGEFYLNAFSDRVEWAEVKDAFKNWNVDYGSAFKDQDPSSVDPDVIKKALDLAKAAKESLSTGT